MTTVHRTLRFCWLAVFTTILLVSRCRHVLSDQVAPVYVPEGLGHLPDDLDYAESGPEPLVALPTVTVRGFLNFRTTVDGTVIVFTPASEAVATQPAPSQLRPDPPTRPPTLEASKTSAAPTLPSKLPGIKDGNVDIQELDYSQNQADLVKKTVLEESRETFKEINAVFPSSANFKSKIIQATAVSPPLGKATKLEGASIAATSGQYPTGLVTVLGGTNVEGGATTIHETKVIGTYIEGKYAQILQSTSRIILAASTSSSVSKPTIKAAVFSSSSTSKSPATVTSQIRPSPTTLKSTLSPTSSASFVFSSRTQRERNNQVSSSLNTFQARHRPELAAKQEDTEHRVPVVKKGDDSINSNTVLQSSFRIPVGAENPQRSGAATQALDNFRSITSGHGSANRFRPTPSLVVALDEDNTLGARNGNSNNNRRTNSNSARLRYILPRRQSQTVRLNRFKVKLTIRPEDQQQDLTKHVQGHNFDDEVIEDGVGVDLSGLDPNKVIFEKATITSEITLHVGRRKSVRTITITTSVPKSQDGSEFESNGIIDPTEAAANNALVATASPAGPEGETPALIISRNKRTDLLTFSRTYSTTERVWRTSIVPYFDGHSTTSHTVTESFFIRKIITAYKTMPPFDVDLLGNETDIDPVPTLDSNQSYQTVLLQGVDPLPPSPQQQLLMQTPSPFSGIDPSYLQLASGTGGNGQLDYSNPLLSLGAALSQNPLAAVYLGLHQLNRQQQQVTQYSTVTRTSSYTTTDTVYSTKVVRLYDGRQTRFRTLSESISTTERVVTAYSTTVEPYINTQVHQQLQQLIGNTQLNVPSVAPPSVTSTITSSYTTVTTATSYSTKIYTLIYNAFSTKYRTVTSTSTYPTTLTTFSTSEVTLAATATPTLANPLG